MVCGLRLLVGLRWFVAYGCGWVCILEGVERDWPKTISVDLWVYGGFD